MTKIKPGFFERFSKSAALTSALVVVALQIALHPDGTPTIRAMAALALIAGWLAAHSSRQSIHAFWLFSAPLAPAALRALTGREGPILDLIWMAGLTGSLLRSVSWSRWTFPAGWSVLLGGWALTLALGWPVIVAREVNFDPQLLRDAGAINSWALLSAPQVVAWTLHVALTQLLGLVWFDWLTGRLSQQPETTPRAVHALWLGATAASIVAIYQGTVDLGFLSTPAWAALRRATGTMLDANAYGVTAAIAGPVGFFALARRSLVRAAEPATVGSLAGGGAVAGSDLQRMAGLPAPRPGLLLLALLVLLVNFTGMWMSGSRTALVCAIGGVVGLAAGLWTSGIASARRAVMMTAGAAAVVLVLLIAAGTAMGPLARLMERPEGSASLVGTLWDRGGYGTIAGRMLRQFPLTGVGLGAYHVIAPDYWRVMTDRQLPFDNAQNWWRHIAAEFGLIGSLAILVWSAVVAWIVIAGRARPGHRPTAAAVRGLIAGIGVCSLLGMPTQTPVVLLSFFLLVAWLGVLVRDPDVPVLPSYGRAGWILVTALAVLYAAGHAVLARGALSVSARAIRSHRDYVSGTYPLEGTPGTDQFRWTRREARFVLQARTPWLLMRVWVHHPDLERNPVRLTIETACGVVFDRALATSIPFAVGVELPPGRQTFEGVIRVSRTWRPSAYGERDPRELGAGVSADFVDSQEIVSRETVVYSRQSCAAERPS